MKVKHISNLKVGDKLKRKEDENFYLLKNIITGDQEGINYGFDGFYVREKVMKKFFHSGNSGFFVYNN